MSSRKSAVPLLDYEDVGINSLYLRDNVMHDKLRMRHAYVDVDALTDAVQPFDLVSDLL